MTKTSAKPTPGKIVFAAVSVLSALGVVAFHLGLFDSIGGDVDDVAFAAEEFVGYEADEDVDWSGTRDDTDERSIDGAGPNTPPGVIAASGGAPDWNKMFESLMAREEQRRAHMASFETNPEDDVREAEEAAGAAAAVLAAAAAAEEERLARLAALTSAERAMAEAARLQLRGVMAEGGRGVALVNGHLVRRGDTVPGTRIVVVAIHRDRLVVSHPDVEAALDVHLAALDGSAEDQSEATSTPSGASESPAAALAATLAPASDG